MCCHRDRNAIPKEISRYIIYINSNINANTLVKKVSLPTIFEHFNKVGNTKEKLANVVLMHGNDVLLH